MDAWNTGMSPGEQRIFLIGLTCVTDGLNAIKVDYELLADKAGLKKSSASVIFGNAKRKFLAGTEEGNTQTPTANSTDPTTPAKANKVTKRTPKSSIRGKDKTTKAAIAAATLKVEPSPTKNRKIKGEAEHNADMIGMMSLDKKVKQDNGNGTSARIKTEFANDLASELIEGTSYPRSELEWSFFEQSSWHVETYKSENEDGA